MEKFKQRKRCNKTENGDLSTGSLLQLTRSLIFRTRSCDTDGRNCRCYPWHLELLRVASGPVQCRRQLIYKRSDGRCPSWAPNIQHEAVRVTDSRQKENRQYEQNSFWEPRRLALFSNISRKQNFPVPWKQKFYLLHFLENSCQSLAYCQYETTFGCWCGVETRYSNPS